MNILGLSITRTKAVSPGQLSSVDSRGQSSWWPVIREPFAGAWQRNMEISVQDALAYTTVWACITLIASDISKLWLKLVEKDADGIWTEVRGQSPFWPVIRKPNRYQTRVKFIEHWMLSKLIRGNTYALKERDGRGIVTALHILDPQRVQVMVAPDGAVYYQLRKDSLARIEPETILVPASEIIHDLNVPLYHPLVGVSAIFACGLAAMQGLKIQNNSEQFFSNMSQPGGVLTAPGLISQATADRIKEHWEANFTGANSGRVAVLGDGLKYEPMTFTAQEAQLIEQLKWTGENVCTAFHVPAWKVGLAPMPPYGNVQAANIEYYSQALQNPIESLEACLDEGLELVDAEHAGGELGVEFDLSALLRMDSATQMELAVKAVGGGIYTPNEGREIFELKPKTGGDSPMMQQQQFSLEALAERDSDKPFSKPTAPAPATPAPNTQGEDKAWDDSHASALLRVKAMAAGLAA